MSKISRKQYADLFGPTTGDKIRLGDTDLYVEIEKDMRVYGDELVTGGGKTLAFVADLLPTRHHIPLPWMMASDLYPLRTLETKRQWIPRMLQGQWIVVFGHDPDVPAATLHESAGKIEIEPVDLNR